MYRYASLLRPLGCWLSLTIPFTIEDPEEGDYDPFKPDWKAHNVLVTEEPLNSEVMRSLQLTDIAEMKRRKALYDVLEGMEVRGKSEYIKSLIKQELGDKIREGKIKNIMVLDKMIKKYEKYAMGEV
jgi:hypothetical protein